MSTIGKSVKDTTPATVYNPVVIVDPLTGQPVSVAGAGIGRPTDTAWNGSDASASLISIMKAIYAQNATMIGLLNDIKTNTTPAP